MSECGLVRALDLGGAYTFYDPNFADHPNHSHIICEECGRIIEFDSAQIAKLEDAICRKLGFTAQARRLQITGSCNAFRETGACPRKARGTPVANGKP
jgi:Fur family ferric uptake transcriptional regulator